MKLNHTRLTGGHEIDPNLLTIADMLRIQDEMHEVTEHVEKRMQSLATERRGSRNLNSHSLQTSPRGGSLS